MSEAAVKLDQLLDEAQPLSRMRVGVDLQLGAGDRLELSINQSKILTPPRTGREKPNPAPPKRAGAIKYTTKL